MDRMRDEDYTLMEYLHARWKGALTRAVRRANAEEALYRFAIERRARL